MTFVVLSLLSASYSPLLSRRMALSTMAAPLAMPPLRTQAAVPTAPTWALSDGVAMPTLALNTAGLTADDSERALTAAVARGITHVDFHPGIERDGVARVLRSSGASNLFLTTKIRKPSEGDSPAAAAEAASKQIADDLAVLGVDGVDMLLLRDHPSCEVMRAQWAVLEAARASGKAKALGTVNYCKGSLSCLLESAKVKPAVNYYMLHVRAGSLLPCPRRTPSPRLSHTQPVCAPLWHRSEWAPTHMGCDLSARPRACARSHMEPSASRARPTSCLPARCSVGLGAAMGVPQNRWRCDGFCRVVWQ